MNLVKLFILLFFLNFQTFTQGEECIETSVAFSKVIPLNLRNGPGDFYNVIYIIKDKNLILELCYKIENWCFIKAEDYKGWVKCSSVNIQKKISFITRDTFLYRIPDKEKIMKIKKYSRIKIMKCGQKYCRVAPMNISGAKKIIRGWVKKDEIFRSNHNNLNGRVP